MGKSVVFDYMILILSTFTNFLTIFVVYRLISILSDNLPVINDDTEIFVQVLLSNTGEMLRDRG